ncbi:MAG: saccharopine dehydrogenase NADP-binding domain-containing protein [Desulfobacterales bacterium]|nr:saccharopine dehydrogenase NADP-binding domain-containing protein [Desulfobacterales bacterium]
MAEKINSKFKTNKIKPIKLDAGKKDEIIKAAEGVDVIFNFTLTEFNINIIEAALAVKAHYLNTAGEYNFLNQWVSGGEITYDKEFKAIGKSALMGCGISPGSLGVLTRYICDQMNKVEKILVRIGLTFGISGDEILQEWDPGWAPEIALADFAEPPMIFKDGKHTKIPIFSNPETYTFPEPIGAALIASHSHEEPYLFPRYYKNKGLKNIDFKYPVDKTAGAFVKMGFADDREVEVNGVKVVPRDVLMKLVKQPTKQFLEENEKTILQSEASGFIVITVDGEYNGRDASYSVTYNFIDGNNRELQKQLYNTYGTTQLYVALPAVTGAKMCMAGETDSGVITADGLDPMKFFKGLSDRGIPIVFEENIVINTEIK